MKILFLTRRAWPEIGGVEKHVGEVARELIKKGHQVNIISEKDIKYPHIKFVGLLYIWFWFFKNRRLIEKSEVVHCHDVFIWYLPFVFIYSKRVFTTIHGLEWNKPLYRLSLIQKETSRRWSDKIVGIGRFLEKYTHIKFDYISYGGAVTLHGRNNKIKKTVVYVGRLEANTGLLNFLHTFNRNNLYTIDFCGDGELRNECEKYGTVHGFCDPTPFYKKAKYCVPGGYLAALEALNYGCELKLFWNNKIKEDYWKMSPFYKLKGAALKKWARQQTWKKLANEYLDLYNRSK